MANIKLQYDNLHPQKKRKAKLEKITRSNRQRLMIANYIDNQVNDYKWIGEQVGLSRQQTRNIAIHYQKTSLIEKSKAGRKSKLTEEHLKFITNFYKDETNIGKTVDDLFLLLVETFDLDYNYVNLSTIYRKLDELNYSYKKILHVKKECNSEWN